MSSERSRDCLVRLLQELYALPRESELVAFHSGRHCAGGPWRGPQADALPALLGNGPKGGAGMSPVFDGHLIGCSGRLPGLGLMTAEAAP
jgi:hypothetical protein